MKQRSSGLFMKSNIGLSVDKAKTFFKRELVSPTVVMRLLLYYTATDPEEIHALMGSLSTAYLTRVLDILSLYPFTNLGWSLLPAKDTLKHISGEHSAD